MSTPVVVFLVLAVLTLIAWGSGKYRQAQAEKRSQELRNLYASVHAQQTRKQRPRDGLATERTETTK